MNCFAVFLKSNNKQIRVYSYAHIISVDMKRAHKLAIDFALANHNNGYPCTIEQFHMCDIGKIVMDTENY